MSRKYFGTDGVRGHVGERPITPDLVMHLGWAAGKVLAAHSDTPSVLIGKDTRLSGYMLESALEAGLSAAGVDVKLLGPLPTPAIAYLTRTFHASAGIVISASHNPHHDNGIKFFAEDGRKLSDALELAIESLLDEPMQCVAPERLGRARRVDDARGRYIEFCKSSFPFSVSLRGLHLVVDCANGAAYHTAPNVFEELGARVTRIAVEPDGLNINRDCGSTHPEKLQQTVLALGADLGIALDGDADRVLMVDHKGELIDGDELLAIMAMDRLRQGMSLPGVVGTLMSNMGLELALRDRGLDFVRARVGDRYVMAELEARGWLLGGESSGHLVCLDCTTTGDGTISALQVLKAMILSGKTLHELKQVMQKLPQTMINVRVAERRAPESVPAIVAAVYQAEQQLAGRGRVLLRPSGTEPLIRVMVEGESAAQVQQLASALADVVREHMLVA